MTRAEVPPPIVERSRGTLFVWLGGAVLLAGALALFFFNPAEHAFYPRCVMKLTTGLDCPGCGGLRATHQLLHGNVRQAFLLNPLFVIALPIAAAFFLRAPFEKLSGKRLPRLLRPATAVWICAAAVIAFGLLRNLPWRAWL